MLERYDIRIYYDVIGKRLDIRIPGLQGSPDNIENSALSQIISLCALNEMKTGQVSHFMAAIGDQAQYNPVAEWVCSKPWDEKDRLKDFYATLTTEDYFPDDMKVTLIFRWLISAIAAAFMLFGFHARGVLVLQGAQSMGKTSWVRNTVSDDFLRETLIKVDHHLDASNKDSIVLAISHWIVELGELESTMKRNIPRLKGFITSDSDKVRLPYAKRESSYQRRTVFCATVNREDFLVDDTGNSRWWTLPLTAIDYNHGIDMQQLWAQVYHIYKTEKPNWWLSRSEEVQLETLNQRHRATSSIRQLIEARIGFEYKRHWVTCSVVNATTILQSLGKQNPSNTEAKECAAVMREHLGEPIRSNGISGWRVNLPDPPNNDHRG
jgi:putative DNA primase/helicase